MNRKIEFATEETKNLVSYVKERFDNEPEAIQTLRTRFASIINDLVIERNSLERGEKSRNLQIAITHLEDACMRAIKAAYMN